MSDPRVDMDDRGNWRRWHHADPYERCQALLDHARRRQSRGRAEHLLGWYRAEIDLLISHLKQRRDELDDEAETGRFRGR